MDAASKEAPYRRHGPGFRLLVKMHGERLDRTRDILQPQRAEAFEAHPGLVAGVVADRARDADAPDGAGGF